MEILYDGGRETNRYRAYPIFCSAWHLSADRKIRNQSKSIVNHVDAHQSDRSIVCESVKRSSRVCDKRAVSLGKGRLKKQLRVEVTIGCASRLSEHVSNRRSHQYLPLSVSLPFPLLGSGMIFRLPVLDRLMRVLFASVTWVNVPFVTRDAFFSIPSHGAAVF